MNCDDDYVNKLEKYKCLVNTIDGNIFNKHNDQEKKTLVKRIFFTCMEFNSILTSVLISSCNFDVEKNSLCVYVSYEYTVTSLVSCCARIVNQNKWSTLLHDRADVTVGYIFCLLFSFLRISRCPFPYLWRHSSMTSKYVSRHISCSKILYFQ